MIDLTTEINQMLVEVKEGWCWPEKAIAMASLVLETQPELVVEIGVFGGRSLLPQALALQKLNHGRIVGIDPWGHEAARECDQVEETNAWWSALNLHHIHTEFIDHLWRLKLHWRCIVIRSTADESSHLFGEESIDILHIDGNHTEEVSCRDVSTWLSKVKSKGHIWFDDTHWESTQKALGLLAKDCEIIRDVGTCRLFQKR